MNRLLTILALSALLIAVGMPLAAQNDAAAQIFAQLDVNKDGKLSQAEFTAHPDLSDDMFGKWDANGDKSISKAEFAAGYGKG